MVNYLYISLLLLMLSASKGFTYGERVGLPEGTPVTADFVDSDGDQIDDRYQKGPGEPIPKTPPKLLPKIEYFGGAESGGVSDLRLGVKLYTEWFNYTHEYPSLLEISDCELRSIEKGIDIGEGSLPTKKFIYGDGTIIYACMDKYLAVIMIGQDPVVFHFYQKEEI